MNARSTTSVLRRDAAALPATTALCARVAVGSVIGLFTLISAGLAAGAEPNEMVLRGHEGAAFAAQFITSFVLILFCMLMIVLLRLRLLLL